MIIISVLVLCKNILFSGKIGDCVENKVNGIGKRIKKRRKKCIDYGIRYKVGRDGKRPRASIKKILI